MNHTRYSNEELKSALEALISMHGVTSEIQHAFDVAADVIRNNIWEPLYENDEWNYPENGSVVRIETGFSHRAEVAVFMKEYDLDGFTYTNAFVGPSGETVVRYSLDAEWQYAPECAQGFVRDTCIDIKAPKKESKIYVRALNEHDREQVLSLDNLSGNYLEQWLDCEGYGWGIFDGDVLMGYCSIGLADDVSKAIKKHPQYTGDSLLLSDVFVSPEFRHSGYGTQMIKQAISLKHEYEGCKEAVFCEPIHDGLIGFYENIGFCLTKDAGMVIPKSLTLSNETLDDRDDR